MPAGLRAIENAKRNGRWENAYHSAKGSTMPEDFLAAMAKNRKANSFFETLNSANRYAILFRIQTAKKAETRARRIEQFIGCWRGTRRSIHERALSPRCGNRPNDRQPSGLFSTTSLRVSALVNAHVSVGIHHCACRK